MLSRISFGLPAAALLALAALTLFGGHVSRADHLAENSLVIPQVGREIGGNFLDDFDGDLDGYLLIGRDVTAVDGAYLPRNYDNSFSNDGDVVIRGEVENQYDEPQGRAHLQVDLFSQLGAHLGTYDQLASMGALPNGTAPFQLIIPDAPRGVREFEIQVIGVDIQPAPVPNEDLVTGDGFTLAQTSFGAFESGSLTNTGTQTFSQIQAVVAHFDDGGRMLQQQLVQVGQPLGPGESADFTLPNEIVDPSAIAGRKVWAAGEAIDPGEAPTGPYVINPQAVLQDGVFRSTGRVANPSSTIFVDDIVIDFTGRDSIGTPLFTGTGTVAVDVIPPGGVVPFVFELPVTATNLAGFDAAVGSFDELPPGGSLAPFDANVGRSSRAPDGRTFLQGDFLTIPADLSPSIVRVFYDAGGNPVEVVVAQVNPSPLGSEERGNWAGGPPFTTGAPTAYTELFANGVFVPGNGP